jgi:hypothetical protein
VVDIHVGRSSIANDGLPALEGHKGFEATRPRWIGFDRAIERKSVDTTRNSSDSGVSHDKRESAREARASETESWRAGKRES